MSASLNGIQLQDEKPKFMCLCMTQLFKAPISQWRSSQQKRNLKTYSAEQQVNIYIRIKCIAFLIYFIVLT